MHISRIFFWHCKWLRLPAINYWISTANNKKTSNNSNSNTNRSRKRRRSRDSQGKWSSGTESRVSFSYVNHINHTPRLRFHLRHWHMKKCERMNNNSNNRSAQESGKTGGESGKIGWKKAGKSPADETVRLPGLNQPWNAIYTMASHKSESHTKGPGPRPKLEYIFTHKVRGHRAIRIRISLHCI